MRVVELRVFIEKSIVDVFHGVADIFVKIDGQTEMSRRTGLLPAVKQLVQKIRPTKHSITFELPFGAE